MTCIAVDDNPMALAVLEELIDQVDFLDLKCCCPNALEAFNLLEKQSIDLVFLDVEMPDMNGLELLESLSAPPLAILVTAKENYALEAYRLHVVDYVVKPISLKRFLAAVGYAQKLFEKAHYLTEKALFVREDRGIVKVELNSILFVKALGDYVQIVTTGGKHTINTRLKNVKNQLPADDFEQIHRSYIVALDKIESIKDNMVVIQDNVIPMSESHKDQLMQRLKLL